jgi:hypothetical protein
MSRVRTIDDIAIPVATELRRFCADVACAFRGRLRGAVLFGSRARGEAHDDSDWDLALFIDGFDRGRESRHLNFLAATYHLRGVRISPLGLPAGRQTVSPELLWNTDHDAVPL